MAEIVVKIPERIKQEFLDVEWSKVAERVVLEEFRKLASIKLSFFKKDSFTRRFILSHPEIELFTPLYVFDELEEHKEEIKSKAKIDERVYELSKKAIWSNDRDLKETQSVVKVFSTSDLISFLPQTAP